MLNARLYKGRIVLLSLYAVAAPILTISSGVQSHRRDITRFLSLFEHKVRENSKLTRHEVNAITAYLTSRVKQFFVFEGATSQLRQLVAMSTVFDANDDFGKGSDDGTESSFESHELLYKIDDPEVCFDRDLCSQVQVQH